MNFCSEVQKSRGVIPYRNEPMMYADPSGHREVEGTEIGGHTEHHTMKPGEATANYYQEKQKETKKGIAEKAISSGKGGMPSQINNTVYCYYKATQDELDALNKFLSPLPPIDRDAIYKKIMMAGEPYASAMIETICSGYYTLVDISAAKEKRAHYNWGSMVGDVGELCVDFTNLKDGGYYPYASFFHELFHAVDDSGLFPDSQMMGLTEKVYDETSALLYESIESAFIQYAKNNPGLSDDTVDVIYNYVLDPYNSDAQTIGTLSNEQYEILKIATTTDMLKSVKDKEYSCVYDMLGGVTNNFIYANVNNQTIYLGAGHGVDKDYEWYEIEGYYYYDYTLRTITPLGGPLIPVLTLNDNLGKEFYAEYGSAMAVAPDSYKQAIQNSLPGVSDMLDDYLKHKYIS